MTFTGKFEHFVCEGDAITCEVDRFEIMACIVRDDCPDAPDERQDGFWPSEYIGDPGFIGPGPNWRQRLAEARAKAEAIMVAWRNDAWFYCGIVLSVSREGVTLCEHAASLWGPGRFSIKWNPVDRRKRPIFEDLGKAHSRLAQWANYPGADNSYLAEVANELLPEALAEARATLARLCAEQDQTPPRG